MRLNTVGLSLVTLLAVAGCASRGEMESLQRDTDELKTRVLQMDKDLGATRNEAREIVEKAQGYQKDMEALRRGAADLQATLDSAKVDLQVLTGKVDDAALLAKKPADDLALVREDMERRFTAIEERLSKLEKGLSETIAREEASPDAIYQKGLATFKNGDPQKARELFTQFLQKFPKHDLAANVHYWLGETYYSEKNYDQAILEFQEVIKNFPGKEKVPAAMLKQAMAFRELGDVKSARYVFKKLIDDFPLADEAKPAREKLKELK
ncbi:tol-pal system protein YbgF [Geobacter sp. AOG1]|uniref:tol-pal system protein YbgF n=1 Tax=Geobacter sp. AOG1 TaxID=1566346 RepID=UPI001CC78E52|nr:tol-pal system protein YbgF [Geobacter sp. AOG1]GFE57036.1 lipoprotein [Geobacter sp. AOG1]